MTKPRAELRSQSRYAVNQAAIKLPSFQLLHGDCRKLLQLIPDQSIQSVITSPPYWGLRSYGVRGEIGAERKLETYLSHLSSVFEELMRVVTCDGTLWVIVGDAYTSGNRRYRDADARHPVRGMSDRPRTPAGLKPKDLIGLPWRIALMIQSLGWHLRTEIIWHKPNALPESVMDRPHRNHEYIFLFSKSKKYFFDNSKLTAGLYGSLKMERSVWKVAVGRSRGGHGATFPIDLIRPCVATSSRPGDIILDPFVGSGTVGVAALQANRSFVGVDLNRSYTQMASRHMSELGILTTPFT